MPIFQSPLSISVSFFKKGGEIGIFSQGFKINRNFTFVIVGEVNYGMVI